MSDESELNSSLLQSAVRKKEYKNLLEIGGQAAGEYSFNIYLLHNAY